MDIKIVAPDWDGKTVRANLQGGPTREILAYKDVEEAAEFTAFARRVNVLSDEVTDPSVGRAAIMSGGRTALNLLDTVSAQTITASMDAGQAAIYVQDAAQKRGHPSGEHYWLPVRPDGRFVCEPGQRHRTWYISKSPTAMTKAQIAANAGVAESAITAAWLMDRTQYGGTPETAVHMDVAKIHITYARTSGAPTRSDHYFMERGYEYHDFDVSGLSGEDELHPVLFGAWGSGARPSVKINSNFLIGHYNVFQDIHTPRNYPSDHTDIQNWYSFATIFDHLDIGSSIVFSHTHFATVRETLILAPYRDYPKPDRISPENTWVANGNHSKGIYGSGMDNLLVDSCLIDHAGWGEGYDYNGSADMPMPVSMYSHSIYLDVTALDITVRDCLLSRGASGGFQLRGGVQIERVLMVDNNVNAAVNSFTGNNQFNNIFDSVVFSAGYRRVAYSEGGYNWGMDVNGPQSTMIGNVIAHSANPDDPAEIAAKPGGEHTSYESAAKLFNDTQVWKWGNKPNREVTNLDPAVLDQTSIQRFTGSKMGKTTATIPEMVTHVAAQPSVGNFVREAVGWTKSRFGRPIPARTTPADVVFEPEGRLDGFRWDNRYNWSTGDLPGTHVADTADLAGNFVRFANVNADIAALESRGGLLDVVSGRLDAGALTDAADIIIRKAGQVWIGPSDQPISVEMSSGRLVLEGAASNVDLYAGGHGHALLGPNATIPAGKSLIISGQRPLVGWDRTGTATLTIGGRLEFMRGIAVTVVSSTVGNIRRVYKHIGQKVTGSISGFTGRVAAVERADSRGNAYTIWLCDVVGNPQVGDVFEVAPSRGSEYNDTINTQEIASIVSQGIAPLQRFRSGAIGNGLTNPDVAATVTLAAGSQVVKPAGLPAGTYDLTGPGVTVVNNGATLPAGVTVTGGKLVLTVS